MANCIPTVPSQPDDAYYPVSKLYIVPTFDRAGYKAAFGDDAPTYDSTRKTKTWFDSTAIQTAGAPDATVQYTMIARDASGNVVPTQISMPAKEAATVNLYGVHSYPAYVVAPTRAYTTDVGAAINAGQLSLETEAIALAQSFGLDASAVSEQQPANAITYPADESRRMWLIAYKGYHLCAGLLLAEMNANGAGAPGHWNLDGAEPNWISDLPSSLAAQNPAWDIPCRPLASNEAIGVSLFGFMIYRKDKQSVYNPTVTSSASSSGSATSASTTAAPVTSTQTSFLARLEQSLLAALKAALAQSLTQ